MTLLRSLLQPVRVLVGLVRLTLKRLSSRPGLTLLALIGIVLAVGLLSSAAFFAQAVDRVILNQELDALSQATGRPPFSTRVYFFPSSRKVMKMEAAEDAGRSIANTLAAEIGLPVQRVGIQLESGSMALLPRSGDTRYNAAGDFLTSVNIVYIADVAQHVETLDGAPFSDQGESGEVLQVWINRILAEKLGSKAGETFEIATNARQATRTPIVVAGIWTALDPASDFWFNPPDMKLKDALVVSRSDYVRFIQPLLTAGSRFASWHITLDDRTLNPANSREYALGFERGMAVVDKYLPGASLDISPLDPLKDFVQRQTTLTTLLLGFNVPALGFLIYFLVLISAIIARWQQRETAMLVSRGMGLSGVFTLILVEEFLLFVIGVPLGLGFGMWIARMMGYTESFLSFVSRDALPVSMQGIDFLLISAALAFSLLARLAPAVQAARLSVVEQERSFSRPLRGPFWQRAYVDVILVIPTYYAYQQLANRGGLAMLVRDRAEDLFRDPLLILVPALFVLTAGLLVMRLFPLLMSILDWVAGSTMWIAPHLALRQLGRHSQSYVNPLLLVVISLALGIYTHSMAASLDQWLVDRLFYQVGADASFHPFLEAVADETGGEWIPPISEFEELPGVLAATRVAHYPAEIDLTGSERLNGVFMALDRADFANVSWYRDDFARESLGSLMNRLAISPDNILVSQRFLNQNFLHIGDTVTIRVGLDQGVGMQGTFIVAGVYDHFVTVYDDRETFIGNLDHLFLMSGAVFPHEIWLRLQPGGDEKELVSAIQRQGIEPVFWQHTASLIETEQSKMERVGIFGTLSAGFIAAALMAFLALLIHSYASLQERLYQFGVLRAVGVMRRQIIGQIALEYTLLTAYGTLAGALIGTTASRLFTPFFRITGQGAIALPPLLPIVAEDQIARMALLFALIIVLIELGVTVQAMSRHIFDALRMGYQE